MRAAVALLLALAALASAAAGCEDVPATPDCGPLPEPTACPTSGGGSCDDPSCSAIFACRGNAWALVKRCANDLDAGAPADAATDGDASACGTVMLPPSSPDCTSLQAPDCDAVIVDECPASACQTGCTDFLRCTPTGWDAVEVAHCDEDGMLIYSNDASTGG